MSQFFAPKYPTCRGLVRTGATVFVGGSPMSWPPEGFNRDRRYSFIELGNGSFEIKRSVGRVGPPHPSVIVRGDDIDFTEKQA